jgi:alcohol dehydrogenase class IV
MITISATTILWAVVGLAFVSILAGLNHSLKHESGGVFPVPGGTGCAWAIASMVVFLLALGCAIGRMF